MTQRGESALVRSRSAHRGKTKLSILFTIHSCGTASFSILSSLEANVFSIVTHPCPQHAFIVFFFLSLPPPCELASDLESSSNVPL
jgi:hypothetical protein